MGTTSGCASDKIAEKTNAVLCAEGELAGRASSLTAKSCRFHSQLACLEKSQHRHADIAQQASHRRQHVGATRVGE